METLSIEPRGELFGEVEISGAKNSVLKLMAACALAPGEFRLMNVPRISDVDAMAEVLEGIGLSVNWLDTNTIEIISPDEISSSPPPDVVEKMRASTILIGVLLSRCGSVEISLPGGDDFGTRPIDIHLGGLEYLGATFEHSDTRVCGSTDRLVGTEITLDYPSVGATENLILAAVRAEGSTTIHNAAREPEIADLAAFVNRMGGHVLGAGSSLIEIRGVSELRSAHHDVIADRIETATFLAMLATAGGEIELLGARSDHCGLLMHKFGEMGVRCSVSPKGIWAMCAKRPYATSVSSLPYPGIATDYLPLFVAATTVATGTSYATENLFSNRSKYIEELNKMGANISFVDRHFVVRGVDNLSGGQVRCHDIRAGAALVIAAVGADEPTLLTEVDHLIRGYDNLDVKLTTLGVGATYL